MTNTTLVSEAFASGEEIGPIVTKIEEVLADVPRTHALIALTSVVLLLQCPDISTEQMYEGVKDVSRFVCMWLAGSEVDESTDPIDKSKMN
jgi:hypothetical protein